MLHTYESAAAFVWTVGGLAALMLGYTWFSYRLSTLVTAGWTGGGLLGLGTCVWLYGFFLLPWLAALTGVRGFDGVGPCANLNLASINLQRLILVGQFICMALVSLRWAAAASARWTLELLAAWLVLQLCWVLLSQAASALTMILWLEVAGLGGVLLLTTAALGFTEARSHTAWRGLFFTRQVQLGFLHTVLIFLWTSGVATLLLLFGLCHGLVVTGGYASDLLVLVTTFGGLATTPALAALAVCLGGGLLVKLLLQPMQFALVTFYRCLRIEVLVFYLFSYYVCFVPLLLTVLYPQLVVLLGSWGTYLVATVCFASCALSRGGLAGGDVRATLAYSTAVTLTLFLVTVALV